MSTETRPTLNILRHLDHKFNETDAKMDEFMELQVQGEEPDPAEFMQLVERQMIVQKVMSAQLQLNEKPVRTVLSEVR